MLDNFAVFILSHGRADNVITWNTLEKQGYTGRKYIVIDNEDDQEKRYYEKYGEENVIKFDKLAVSKTFDTMDTQNERRTVVYARNACFDIAKQIGVRYFAEFDDDYMSFEHRYIKDDKLKMSVIENLDAVFSAMLQFLIDSNADTVAFAQGGDLLGGKDSIYMRKRVMRKAMNTFFCDAEKPFKFIGRINEDVNTYTYLGSVGWRGFTVIDVSIRQGRTQSNKGGMTDVYVDSGTYLKSFYSVMIMPSAVKIGIMTTTHKRIHHHVDWECCSPKILSEEWKKSKVKESV